MAPTSSRGKTARRSFRAASCRRRSCRRRARPPRAETDALPSSPRPAPPPHHPTTPTSSSCRPCPRRRAATPPSSTAAATGPPDRGRRTTTATPASTTTRSSGRTTTTTTPPSARACRWRDPSTRWPRRRCSTRGCTRSRSSWTLSSRYSTRCPEFSFLVASESCPASTWKRAGRHLADVVELCVAR